MRVPMLKTKGLPRTRAQQHLGLILTKSAIHQFNESNIRNKRLKLFFIRTSFPPFNTLTKIKTQRNNSSEKSFNSKTKTTTKDYFEKHYTFILSKIKHHGS
jgi:hypothetical protein